MYVRVCVHTHNHHHTQVIQFLQTCEPAVLPCLQAASIEYGGKTHLLPPAVTHVGKLEIRYHGCQVRERDGETAGERVSGCVSVCEGVCRGRDGR